KKLSEGPEVVKKVRELASEIERRDPNLQVRLTGMVIMNNAFFEYSQKDSRTLVPIMLGVILLITYISLRSGYGTLATLLVMIFSIVTAMGLAGWLGFKLTPPSAIAPTIILTLAIADSIHILTTLFYAMRQGMNKREALVESLRINWQAVFLTSFTTVIGFLSLNFNEVPPFRDLGNIVAMGVVAAWLYSVTFLPALVALLPVRVKPAAERGTASMERFAQFVVNNSRPLLWGMALLTVGLLLLIPRNEMNDQFVNYFDKDVEFRNATDFTVANLSGVYLLGYSLKAGASGAISEPEYLRTVDEFAEWLRAQPRVMHVTSLIETMKRLNKNMHGDDPAYYRIPESRELAAQYLLLYEMSLPFGLDLNNQINVDKSSSLLRVSLENLSSKETIAMDQKAQAWLREHAPPYMLTQAADPTIMFSHIGQRSTYSMISGNVVALILISGILIFAFRNLKIGLISLIPNLIPAGMAFGLWALLVGQVGMASSVITSLTFGIVVDDTIHFLSKYLLARREQGLTAREAVLYAYRTVGMAMCVTTLILVAGFSVLTLSDFEINYSMGLLSSITLSFALLADLILLPLLLLKWDGKHDEKIRIAAEPVRATSAN
ncbi:MAG: MMPL family transporter, partial [Gammaproteobacteria bacterium]